MRTSTWSDCSPAVSLWPSSFFSGPFSFAPFVAEDIGALVSCADVFFVRPPNPNSADNNGAAAVEGEVTAQEPAPMYATTYDNNGNPQLVNVDDKEPPLVDLNTTQETVPLTQEAVGIPIDSMTATNHMDGDLAGVMQEQAYLNWEKFCQRQDKRVHRTRIVSAIANVFVIVGAGLFCAYGYKYINRTFDSVRGGFGEMQTTLSFTIDLLNNLEASQNSSSEENRQALEAGNGMCTNVQPQLCNKTDDNSFSCNTTGVPFIGSEMGQILEIVYGSKSWVFDQLTEMRGDLQEMHDDLDSLVNGQNDLEWAFWISFSFSCFIGVQCCIMLWALHVAHKGDGSRPFKFYRRHFLFPMFVIAIIIAYVFTCVFIIAAVGSSDFCIGSPNPKVDWLLTETEGSGRNLVWDFAKYYVNQCPSDGRPTALTAKIEVIIALMNRIVAVIGEASNNAAEWEAICGSDVGIVEAFGAGIASTACGISKLLESIKRVSWCRNWTPIYNQFMYDAICYDAQEGLAWVASSMFCILVFGFVILFLRAAVFEVETEGEFYVGVQGFVHCCKGMFCRKRNSKDDTEAPKHAETSANAVEEVHLA